MVQCTSPPAPAAAPIDLVKGIRGAEDEGAFISQAVQGLKEDMKSRDFKAKSLAVQKLTYVRLAWRCPH